MNLTAGATYNLTVIARVEGDDDNFSGLVARLTSPLAEASLRASPLAEASLRGASPLAKAFLPMRPADCFEADGATKYVGRTGRETKQLLVRVFETNANVGAPRRTGGCIPLAMKHCRVCTAD
eukprot:2948710-Pyramimonas_sp.AAC.1